MLLLDSVVRGGVLYSFERLCRSSWPAQMRHRVRWLCVLWYAFDSDAVLLNIE